MKSKKATLKVIFMIYFAFFAIPILAIPIDFHGTIIEDPFFWLEDMNSKKTLNWLDDQVKKTNLYFENLPYRNTVKQIVSENSNYPIFTILKISKNSLFFLLREKNQEKFSLYMQDDSTNRKKLIDMKDSQNNFIKNFNISPNGEILAYGISNSGSDVQTWKFLKLVNNNKNDFQDEIGDIKFSEPVWKKDNKGIYYHRFFKDSENSEEKRAIYYHELGSCQKNDKLIFDTTNYKNRLIKSFYITQDNKFLMTILIKKESKNNTILLTDLATNETQKISFNKKARFNFITENQKKLFFITNLDAPNNRVIAIDLNTVNLNNFQEIVKEEKHVLIDALILEDHIVLNYLKNCASKLSICDLSGKFQNNIKLPGKGTSFVLLSNPIENCQKTQDDFLFYSYTDFTTPISIFKYDISNHSSSIFFQPILNRSEYLTKQVFFPSKDNTSIPMFITYKKDLDFTKPNPTLMYGYGGFNVAITPTYSSLVKSFLDIGGIYVSVNLRGGSEYGNKWYEKGKLNQKQNVFDDFIEAGEYLIEKGYTSSEKLSIIGRSNGGLLVGALLTQRPDLFAASIAIVGVFDMLKFHKFTIGWAWMGDYGNPEIKEDFQYLYNYSPYHNIKNNQEIPSTLLITGDSDDRVVPMHSYKFAAQLQNAQIGTNPILLRVNRNSGHFSSQSLFKSIEENTDILTFLINELKIEIKK